MPSGLVLINQKHPSCPCRNSHIPSGGWRLILFSLFPLYATITVLLVCSPNCTVDLRYATSCWTATTLSWTLF